MTALRIYQDALTVVSEAVLRGDFDRYATMIDLPYLLHTQTASLLVTTGADLRPTFDALSNGLRTRGITHYERVAREAEFVDRDRIEGWHHTHLLSNGERLAYPHASRHVIVRRGNRWLFSEGRYDILKANRWPLTDEDIFAHASIPVSTKSEG